MKQKKEIFFVNKKTSYKYFRGKRVRVVKIRVATSWSKLWLNNFEKSHFEPKLSRFKTPSL
ncbi:hypothetical protein BpHYR1_030356 [Brachionus plicatilis]|uniref:Uncharacterized protein n=1 Tax=Brachionus plicatilis TaxID=10195 RepID=A0A3M7RCG7_BRAPC|nr:hypothetical protein BpHYR1_030356 [Brachionus plicatilis]